MPEKIQKRDKRITEFDPARITEAVFKAFEASGQPSHTLAKEVKDNVLLKLNQKYRNKIKKAVPSIEEIQDFVEESLIEKGFAKAAKAYILYRQKRSEVRREKQDILDKIDIDEVDKMFDPNALRVLRSRYLDKDESGKVVESPKQLFQRVAVHIVLPNILFDKLVYRKKKKNSTKAEECPNNREEIPVLSDERSIALENTMKIGVYPLNRFHARDFYRVFKSFEEEGKMKVTWERLVRMMKKDQFRHYEKNVKDFYELMVSRNFMPNTPTLANFGSYLGMGSACFALDIEDSIDSIMETLKEASIIFKSGGGLGYNFSKLRPEGDFIKTTGGTSSGPISFMKLFDTMTEVVKQGGIRRGANMGIMNSNHPDIEKFIVVKEGNRALKNFNISVLLMPDFWDAYKKDKAYALLNPRTGKEQNLVSPKNLFEKIVYHAWEAAEPGVLFYDRINEYNPLLKALGPITTTNPCGELLLYPNESCNLGSLNLWDFIKTDARERVSFDWVSLESAVRRSVRFLDNVIDINKFPLDEIREMTLRTRKIGLGVMGLGDLLFELGIPYNSQKGRNFMEKIAEFINYYSKIESMQIARERGPFPLFKKSDYAEEKMPFRGFYEKKSWNFDWKKLAKDVKKYGIRNSYTTVIAPTGSISMIAGCSSGIEPVYSLVYQKNVAVGSFYYIDPVFERTMLREGLFDESLIEGVLDSKGSVQNINYISPHFKKIFVTSHDIKPEDHVRSLASFQKWTDSSISKTINFPKEATVKDMEKVYLLAYELGCKGTTVYRDTSIKDQVLDVSDAKKKKKEREKDKIDGLQRLKDEKAEGMAIYRDSSSVYFNGNGGKNGQNNGKITHCPNCKVQLTFQEGCMSCPVCSWGLCA